METVILQLNSFLDYSEVRDFYENFYEGSYHPDLTDSSKANNNELFFEVDSTSAAQIDIEDTMTNDLLIYDFNLSFR